MPSPDSAPAAPGPPDPQRCRRAPRQDRERPAAFGGPVCGAPASSSSPGETPRARWQGRLGRDPCGGAASPSHAGHPRCPGALPGRYFWGRNVGVGVFFSCFPRGSGSPWCNGVPWDGGPEGLSRRHVLGSGREGRLGVRGWR